MQQVILNACGSRLERSQNQEPTRWNPNLLASTAWLIHSGCFHHSCSSQPDKQEHNAWSTGLLHLPVNGGITQIQYCRRDRHTLPPTSSFDRTRIKFTFFPRRPTVSERGRVEREGSAHKDHVSVVSTLENDSSETPMEHLSTGSYKQNQDSARIEPG